MNVIRLRTPLFVALGASIVLSSCATFSNDAARVDGQSLSKSDLDALVGAYTASAGTAETAGPQDAELVRNLVTTWVTTEVITELIARSGGSVTDEDLTAASDKLDAAAGFASAGDEVRDLFIRNEAASRRLAALLAPDASELEASYEAGSAESGVVCVRAILVDTKDAIDAVALRLVAGESFADVATDASIDPSSADGGALLGDGDNACIDYASVVDSVAPEFVSALDATPIGSPSATFEIPSVGWAILLPRPFSEVSDDVAELLGGQIASEAIATALADAHVWIDATIGQWNTSLAAVEKLG